MLSSFLRMLDIVITRIRIVDVFVFGSAQEHISISCIYIIEIIPKLCAKDGKFIILFLYFIGFYRYGFYKDRYEFR